MVEVSEPTIAEVVAKTSFEINADDGEASIDSEDQLSVVTTDPADLGHDKETTAEWTIHMVLAGASNLIAADDSGFSDPFAVVELVDATRKKHKVVKNNKKKPYIHTSKIIFDTLDPKWNESFTWEGITKKPEELLISIKLFDADMLGDMLVSTDPLGEIMLPVNELPIDSESALNNDCWSDLEISQNMYAITGSLNFRATLHELTTEEKEEKKTQKAARKAAHAARKAAEAAEVVASANRKRAAKAHRIRELRRKREERVLATIDAARQSIISVARQISISMMSCWRNTCKRHATTEPFEDEIGSREIATAVEVEDDSLRAEAERQAMLKELLGRELSISEREREKAEQFDLERRKAQERAEADMLEDEKLARLQEDQAMKRKAAEIFALRPVQDIIACARQNAIAFKQQQSADKVKREYFQKAIAADDKNEEALRYMVKVWTIEAESGNLEAQVNLGDAFMRGRGVAVDLEQALHWWTKSAAQGHIESQAKVLDIWAQKAKCKDDGSKWTYHMGHVFETGLYVAVDLLKAISWYSKAKRQGHPEAQVRILSCERTLAAAGVVEGQVRLGTSYWNGDGVPEDKEQAVTWWRRAAEQRDSEAQYFLGCAYQTGEGLPNGERDVDMALSWFKNAAEQNHLGARKKMADHWRGRARRGDADAQILLGKAYIDGRGVQQNTEKALTWWATAAAQKSQAAMMLLADVHYNAKGLPRNKAKGVEWWISASDLGNIEAQYLVGRAYAIGGGCAEEEEGQGIMTNLTEAVHFWRRAAANGHQDAQFSLGNAYFYGAGIPKDIEKAKHWWAMSSERGSVNAEHMLTIAHRFEDKRSRNELPQRTPQCVAL